MDRTEIFQRIESTWQELQEAIDGIPAGRMEEPGVADEWSVKDLIGHVAYWEQVLSAKLQHLEPDEVVKDLSTDQINARAQEQISVRSLEEVQAEFTEVHDQLMHTLQAMEQLDSEDLKGDTWEHYEEHTAGIRAWREREGI